MADATSIVPAGRRCLRTEDRLPPHALTPEVFTADEIAADEIADAEGKSTEAVRITIDAGEADLIDPTIETAR